jgi:copper chaperone CopZ
MKQLDLTVSGMSCTGCEQRIANSLRRLDGVQDVTADHISGAVVVHYKPEAVQPETIIERLEIAGYETVAGQEPR